MVVSQGFGSRRPRRSSFDAPIEGTAADQTPDADPEAVARTIALRQLENSAKTRAQLEDTLRQRGVSDEVAAKVLDRFTEVNLIDDEQFAQQWVESRHTNRRLSRRMLEQELLGKGISRDIAQAAVENIDNDSELAAATELVRSKMRTMLADDPARRTRRLYGMLARKGYSADIARTAINTATNDMDKPAADQRRGSGPTDSGYSS